MAIPLEDQFTDIIGKAQRGLGLSDSALASKAGLDAPAIQRLRAGDFDAGASARLASALGLNARALEESALQAWAPRDVGDFPGLAQFNTEYGDMTVNAYLIWDEASKVAAAFDTGADVSGMLAALREHSLALNYIFLTHTHGDHIFDLDRLKEKTGAPAFVSAREPLVGVESIEPGRKFSLGALRIETRLTWGHSRGGMTYVIHGLGRPVAVVGDALFAGSMGGGMVSYEAALETNRREIFSLPDETILCPGHGPMSSTGEEKKHNPFFAA